MSKLLKKVLHLCMLSGKTFPEGNIKAIKCNSWVIVSLVRSYLMTQQKKDHYCTMLRVGALSVIALSIRKSPSPSSAMTALSQSCKSHSSLSEINVS